MGAINKKAAQDKILTIVLIVIGALIFFSNVGLFAIGDRATATRYSTYTSTKDNLIYQGMEDADDYRNAFRSSHVLMNLINPSNSNKQFFRFYLEMNGIDSSKFQTYSGSQVLGVFQPKISMPSECTDTPLGEYVSELQALGFVWDWHCHWKGNYDLSKLEEKLQCRVIGNTMAVSWSDYFSPERSESQHQSYDIKGTVEISGDNILCNVDTSKLMNLIPDTYMMPDGTTREVGFVSIDGQVLFEKRATAVETCGDGICDASQEDCDNCQEDCGSCQCIPDNSCALNLCSNEACKNNCGSFVLGGKICYSNNTVYKEIFVNRTCVSGLVCPEGYSCQTEGTCIKTVTIEPTFLEKYGLLGMVTFLMLSIIIFLIIRGKR